MDVVFVHSSTYSLKNNRRHPSLTRKFLRHRRRKDLYDSREKYLRRKKRRLDHQGDPSNHCHNDQQDSDSYELKSIPLSCSAHHGKARLMCTPCSTPFFTDSSTPIRLTLAFSYSCTAIVFCSQVPSEKNVAVDLCFFIYGIAVEEQNQICNK